MGRVDWTDRENDEVVADYFAMLEADLSDEPYVKPPLTTDFPDVIFRLIF